MRRRLLLSRTAALVAAAVATVALAAVVWLVVRDGQPAEGLVAIATGGPFAVSPSLERDLDGMAGVGARWIRVDFNWTGAQPDGPRRRAERRGRHRAVRAPRLPPR